MRIEIDLKNLKQVSLDNRLEAVIGPLLSELGLPLSADDKLLFWEQHFGEYGWAKYDNGKRKGGTMRFKDGAIRVPAYKQLPVYESTEFKNELNPRGLVYIDRLIVAHPADFTKDELALDGFEDAKHLVSGMQTYYPHLSQESVLSFFRFMDTIWDPNPDLLRNYFKGKK